MSSLAGDLSSSDPVREAFTFLREHLPVSLQKPQVAIVCGSGLGGLASTICDKPRAEFDYSSIPHFPRLTGKQKVCLTLQPRTLYSPISAWACGETCLRALG
jgi:purine-nucleoside phosphorylase